MTLYHGTNEDIQATDLTRGLRHKDFGKRILSDTRQNNDYPYGTEEDTAFWRRGDAYHL